jgi:hypothetical protein
MFSRLIEADGTFNRSSSLIFADHRLNPSLEISANERRLVVPKEPGIQSPTP